MNELAEPFHRVTPKCEAGLSCKPSLTSCAYALGIGFAFAIILRFTSLVMVFAREANFNVIKVSSRRLKSLKSFKDL